MSPEQIEGKEADAHSDIFAFGAVLYEAVSGKAAFEGKSQLSVATAILKKDPPPPSALQPGASAELDHVIQACLAKNPQKRFPCAHDIGLALRWIASKSPSVAAAAESPKWVVRALWVAILMLMLLAVIADYWLKRETPSPVVRSDIAFTDDMALADAGNLALSPRWQQSRLCGPNG
jgi:eukaryotic-like serine/threonine-protein kinase